MKQFVYSFILLVVALSAGAPNSLFAQCTPLDTIPGDAIIDPLPFTEEMPENGIRDTACVGEDFVTVFNIEVPESVAFPPFGTLNIDSVIVSETGVEGLPTGLDFSINPSDRVFYPNTTGCIQVAGVPAAGTEGQYALTITVTLYSGFFTQAITLPDGTVAPGEYNLFVRETGNPACQPNSITEQANTDFSVNVFPNPASNLVNAEFTATEAGLTQIALADAHGRIVRRVYTDAVVGENRVSLETNDLQSGLYTLLISKGAGNLRSGVSSRLIINQ